MPHSKGAYNLDKTKSEYLQALEDWNIFLARLAVYKYTAVYHEPYQEHQFEQSHV